MFMQGGMAACTVYPAVNLSAPNVQFVPEEVTENTPIFQDCTARPPEF